MNYLKLSIAIDQYISSILPIKSKSHEKMQKSQLRYWKSQLGDYRMNQITPEMIQLPKGKSPATCNRYLAALSAVFNNFGNVVNPVSRVKKYKEPRGRVRFLSDDERIRLLEACKKSRSKILYPVIVLALSTGMRKMEILKLTWGQVDLQRGSIHLSDTKNGERRTIPIAGHALELISQLPHRSQYVFPTRTGNYPRHINDAWYPMIQKTGIQDFRFHDLRHTAASYMAMQGVPLLTIGTILGHKNLEVTRRYAHLNPSHLRGVLGNLNDMMFPDV